MGLVIFPPLPNGCEIGLDAADNPKAGVELPNAEIELLFVVEFVDEGVKFPNMLDGVLLLCCCPPKENIELDGALVVVVVAD